MFGCIDNVEVRDHGYKPGQADYQRREINDAVAAYERALRGGSPRAVIAQAGQCRKLRIRLSVEDALPVVVAWALVGERHRFARSSRQWLARFVLDGRPPPDEFEQDLAAACLAAIEPSSSCRGPALRCLAAIIGRRQHELTSDALDKWASNGGQGEA